MPDYFYFRDMAGRPTKYNQEVQKLADEYVNGGYLASDEVVPTHAGLAVFLDVTRSTIYLWKETHKEFSDTLDRISTIQEKISLSGGLKGDLNSTIVKLLLANHGYSDKQNIDHTSGGEKITLPPLNFADE